MTDLIGIDVSMGKSNVAVYHDHKCIDEYAFHHTKTGFQKLATTVAELEHPTLYFEATGIYSRPLVRFCTDQHWAFTQLNPLQLHFNTQDLRRIKNDTTDARKIGLAAYDNTYRLFTQQKPIYGTLRELNRFYQRMIKDIKLHQLWLHTTLQQTFPELEALFSSRVSKLALNIIELYPHPDFVKGLGHIKLRNQLMKNTDKKLSKTKATQKAEALLDYAKDSAPAAHKGDVQVAEVRYYAHELKALIQQKEKIQKQLIAQAKALPEFEILTSMPGIGELTASRIIGEVGDFTRFDNAKQINAYIGIDLRQYQSGTYRAIDHINKRGDPYARGLFYLTVANMRRVYGLTKVPNHIVDFYYRLRKKGPHPKLDKVATVACMNKLIKCLFVMIKSHQTYNYKLYHGLEAQ